MVGDAVLGELGLILPPQLEHAPGDLWLRLAGQVQFVEKTVIDHRI